MDSSIRQMVALVSIGNQFLRGQAIDGFWPANSAFALCDAVRFVTARPATTWRSYAETLVSEDPRQWLAALRERRARRLALLRLDGIDAHDRDRMRAAFIGGGGDWAIQVEGEGEIWQARWDPRDHGQGGGRSFTVTYGQVPAPAARHARQEDQAMLTSRLGALLAELEAFARSNGCAQFADIFARAAAVLAGATALPSGCALDLLPSGASDARARRALACCQVAWVFGGGGSWSDASVTDHARYQRLTQELIELVNRIVLATANA